MKQERLFELHADLCKTLSNPVRLKILSELQEDEMAVGALAKILGVRQAHLSQHLSVLRQRGVVKTRREGQNIYYSISSQKIVKACSLIREALLEQLRKNQNVIAEAKKR